MVEAAIRVIFGSLKWNWKARVLVSLTCAIMHWWIVWRHHRAVKLGLQLLLLARVLRHIYLRGTQSHICSFFWALIKMHLNYLLRRNRLLQETFDDVHANQAALLHFTDIKLQSFLICCDVFVDHEGFSLTFAHFIIQLIELLLERAEGSLGLSDGTQAFFFNTV